MCVCGLKEKKHNNLESTYTYLYHYNMLTRITMNCKHQQLLSGYSNKILLVSDPEQLHQIHRINVIHDLA